MVACLLINNLKGTLIENKLLWIALAYALASYFLPTARNCNQESREGINDLEITRSQAFPNEMKSS